MRVASPLSANIIIFSDRPCNSVTLSEVACVRACVFCRYFHVRRLCVQASVLTCDSVCVPDLWTG